MSLRVSVIIPALVLSNDLAEQARNAITSVKDEDTEVIVVDNGSTHGVNLLRSLADIYLRFPEKIGFGPACNAGLKLAKGDFLCISSIDVEYKEGTPYQLSQYWNNFGALCPSALDKPQQRDDQLHFNETFGATFIVSRQVYDQVKLPEGLYDERFEHGYYEDADLWERLDELNLPLVRSGHIMVFHGQGTTNKHLGVLDKYMEINKQKFIEKWGRENIWRG